MQDFNFKKKFGQNFISDTNLLKAIVRDAGVESQDEVLEIGPGAGTLTKELCEKAKKVVSFEIDTELRPILEEKLSGYSNSIIVFKDFMKSTEEEISSYFDSKISVVANIPYYITTPIIFKLLESSLNLKNITIMIQKEVANRLVAKEGTSDYGAITAIINTLCDVKLTRIVNRNMFTPSPNVDSAIVRMDINKNKYQIDNMEVFRKTVTSAFKMRRKTLFNNLKSDFNFSSEQIIDLLTSCGLDVKIRGEKLSCQDFVNLSNLINRIS